MKSFQAVRTHLSPYQHPDFMQMEKSLLENLPGIEYRPLEKLHPDKEIILLTNTHTKLSQLPGSLFSRTRLIVHANSGYDNFSGPPEESLWEKIPVVIGHTIRAQAVVEYSLGCLFEATQSLPQHLIWNKGRHWSRELLKDIPVCIFGYGHIGSKLAATLTALGVQVTIVDPFIQECPHPHFKYWQELDLKKIRVVISCMGLNATSRKLFNEDFFAKAHESLIFINGARGGLVDEVALKNFLRSHPEAWAFLDVFENEPFGDEWHNFPQVWKTSHIAGVHQKLDQGILDFEHTVLSDFLTLSDNEFTLRYKKELLQFKRIQGELI